MCNQLIMSNEEDQRLISARISRIQKLSDKMAKLKAEKESLERELISAFHHNVEGQRSYDFIDTTVTIKTGTNYSLDKKVYEQVKRFVPEAVNPVEMRPTYYIDKSMLREIRDTRSHDWDEIVSKFIKTSEAKPSVKIQARV